MRASLPLVLLSLLGACLEPLDPNSVEVALVRVTVGGDTSTVDTVQVRATTSVRAVAYAREGYDIGLRDFTYQIADTTIAVVDAQGTVRGVAPGATTIRATTPRGQSGEARIVVVPTTIAYTIPIGASPGAVAFSTDYTRAYVVAHPDSLVVIDATGFLRLRALSLGDSIADVATSGSTLYATHPTQDLISVVATATNVVTGRVWGGSHPAHAVSGVARGYVSTRGDARIITVEEGAVTLGIPVGGEPQELALSRDGRRLFAAVRRGARTDLVAIATEFPDTLGSLPLDGTPTGLATNSDGSRVYVLFGASERVVIFAETAAGGRYAPVALIATGASPGGIAVRQTGTPYVVVSGEPAMIFDGETLAVSERIPGAGTGRVAIRPDGLFAFIADRQRGRLNVVGL